MPSGLGIAFVLYQTAPDIKTSRYYCDITGEARAATAVATTNRIRMLGRYGEEKNTGKRKPQPVEFKLIPDSPDFVFVAICCQDPWIEAFQIDPITRCILLPVATMII